MPPHLAKLSTLNRSQGYKILVTDPVSCHSYQVSIKETTEVTKLNYNPGREGLGRGLRHLLVGRFLYRLGTVGRRVK